MVGGGTERVRPAALQAVDVAGWQLSGLHWLGGDVAREELPSQNKQAAVARIFPRQNCSRRLRRRWRWGWRRE